ncbi:MAG: hypothetical protein HY043_19675 [Verrucomicrobia bacterium]|nr:hypothetical protein [Verrucomicrobiota bacterium]
MSSRALAGEYFQVTVVDEQTGRGVPLVELETVNHARWWTDSNGIVAFDEPGLMGQEVYFHVRSHGYEYPKDFFGNRGVKLKTTRDSSATIKIKRLNIAERLYRITGEGIYRDSVLVGHSAPTRRPLLNGQVMGQDTVIATPYRGKLHWFWGDTDRVSYPLGNFGASGATSELPGRGGLDPSVGVDLTYFVDDAGFSKPMCPLPEHGLRWIESLLTVPDERGVERLVARVAHHRDLGPAQGWYLMVFNDEKTVFESVQHWEIHDGHDSAHPFRARVEGVEYFYLYPNWRVKADLKSLYELKNYEALTCVAGDGKIRGKETELDRDATEHPRYSWKAGADRLSPGRVSELIAAGKLKPEESWIDLHDFETGARVQAGRGSVYWNEFRRRWAMIVSAQAGEIWFSEADTPVGPWVYARRVVSHDNYNFYNPTQHPFFDQEGGRLIYFEGTYTAAFSGAQEKTPRYDYNQIMYRLTLDDPRLVLPAPVYRVKSADGQPRYQMREGIETAKAWESVEEAAFFAVPPRQARAGLVPIFLVQQNGHTKLQAGVASSVSSGSKPSFFALPASEPIPAEILDGRWRCNARTSDGAELAFELELAQHGSSVEVVKRDAGAAGTGSLKDGRLTLQLTREGQRYALSATLRERKLAGDWKQLDGDLHGTWSGDWIDPSPSEDRSPAVVALYEYRSDTGQLIYSTDPHLANGALKRSDAPVCRIWKTPMNVLVLDTKATPIHTQ